MSRTRGKIVPRARRHTFIVRCNTRASTQLADAPLTGEYFKGDPRISHFNHVSTQPQWRIHTHMCIAHSPRPPTWLSAHKVSSITDKCSSDIDRVTVDHSWLDLWDNYPFDQPDGRRERERESWLLSRLISMKNTFFKTNYTYCKTTLEMLWRLQEGNGCADLRNERSFVCCRGGKKSINKHNFKDCRGRQHGSEWGSKEFPCQSLMCVFMFESVHVQLCTWMFWLHVSRTALNNNKLPVISCPSQAHILL